MPSPAIAATGISNLIIIVCIYSLNPLNPKNASDMRLAIMKVIGTSYKALGTSANSSLSLMPAITSIASV